jgi:hypothetical protein
VDDPPGLVESARIARGAQAAKTVASSAGYVALRPVAMVAAGPNAPVARVIAVAPGPSAVRSKALRRRSS